MTTSHSPPGAARMTISFISAEASFRRCLRVITRDGARPPPVAAGFGFTSTWSELNSSKVSIGEWGWARGVGGSTEMVVAAVYMADESISLSPRRLTRETFPSPSVNAVAGGDPPGEVV